MSWDITVQRFGKEYASIAEIPDDEQCVILGSSEEVRAAITDFSQLSIGLTVHGASSNLTTVLWNSTWERTSRAMDS